jgi:hypothetical protein
LVTDANGKPDEQLSQAISRRHIEFFIQSGRLCARVTGSAGIMIGDHKHGADDAIAVINHGDVIKRACRSFPTRSALQVRMRANYGSDRRDHHNTRSFHAAASARQQGTPR